MLRRSALMSFVVAILLPASGGLALRAAQDSQSTDPVVARVEGSVILQSQVNQLNALQVLTQTVPDSQDALVRELIDQSIVMADAKAAGFPAPSDQLVDIEVTKISGQFANSEAFVAKLRDVGLSIGDLRQMLSRQVMAERYLNHKFRPSIQINHSDIEAYYQNEWLPALSRENESTVPLTDAEDQIREVLTQREVRERSAKWISDTKSHMKIEQVGSTTATR